MLGVAVGFELQLRPLPVDGMLSQATAIWPLALGLQAFQWYCDWQRTAPTTLETSFAMANTPVGLVATVSLTNFDPTNSTEVIAAIEVRGRY